MTPPLGVAHPMGNFSISHYAGIKIQGDLIELRYLIDMAEIPIFQEIQQTGIVPKVGDRSLGVYLARKAEVLKQGLIVEVNGRPLSLQAVSQEGIFPPGAGGLPTMKLGFLYRAPLVAFDSGGLNHLHYRDGNFPERAGWKEIVTEADPRIAIVSSSVSGKDRSLQLSNYPTDLLNSPPQDLETRVAFRDSGLAEGSKQKAAGSNKQGPGTGGWGLEAREEVIPHRDGRELAAQRSKSKIKNECSEPTIPNPGSRDRHGRTATDDGQRTTDRF